MMGGNHLAKRLVKHLLLLCGTRREWARFSYKLRSVQILLTIANKVNTVRKKLYSSTRRENLARFFARREAGETQERDYNQKQNQKCYSSRLRKGPHKIDL